MLLDKFRKELNDCILYRRSVIFIEAVDFVDISKEIDEAFKRNGMGNTSATEWSTGFGENNFNTGYWEATGGDLREIVEQFINERNKILVLKEINSELQDNKVLCSMLQHFILFNDRQNVSKRSIIIILSSEGFLCGGITQLFHHLIYPYPDNKDIEIELSRKNGEKDVYEISKFIKDKPAQKQKLICSLQGMHMYEIRRLLRYANESMGKILPSTVKLFYEEKKRIVRDSGIMEIIDTNLSMSRIGGLENLIEYLKRKKDIIYRPDLIQKYNLPMPKGVLLVGDPGCGKTIMAKAIATFFNYPLLRMDVGKLMGMYVGQSEHNLSKAIAVTEAAQPCVLWIDEIEKAFAGSTSSHSDVTVRRMIGNLLTWMQERTSAVYIAATANSIEKEDLPPELTRKGRFDDVFFVTYPQQTEREKILKIHLSNCNVVCSEEDLRKIAVETDCFSGAELESLVQKACENYIKEKELLNKDISFIEKINELINNGSYQLSGKEKETRKGKYEMYKIKGFLPAS